MGADLGLGAGSGRIGSFRNTTTVSHAACVVGVDFGHSYFTGWLVESRTGMLCHSPLLLLGFLSRAARSAGLSRKRSYWARVTAWSAVLFQEDLKAHQKGTGMEGVLWPRGW